MKKILQGQSEGIDFWGQSFVADTMGKIITQASSDNAETIHD